MRYSVQAFIICLLLISTNMDAQRWRTKRYEAGIGVGTTHIFGDIGGGANQANWMGLRDIRLDATRPSIAGNFRYRLSDQWATKFSFIYGFGYSTDENSINAWRNYSSKTHIIEPSIQGEYYLITEDRRQSSTAMYYKRGMGSNYTRLGLYLFTGVGLAACFVSDAKPATPPLNPGTNQTVNTQYEVFKKFAFSPVIPAGVGVKVLMNPDMILGAELGGRLSFSDLIDGYYYDRPANESKDIYYFTTFSFTYRLKNDRANMPIFIKNWFFSPRGTKFRNRPLN